HWKLAGEDGRQELADGELDRQHDAVGCQTVIGVVTGAGVEDRVAARRLGIAHLEAKVHADTLLFIALPRSDVRRTRWEASPSYMLPCWGLRSPAVAASYPLAPSLCGGKGEFLRREAWPFLARFRGWMIAALKCRAWEGRARSPLEDH